MVVPKQLVHLFCPFSASSSSQEEKDSDTSKETLDDLFPDDQDDQAPGCESCFLLHFPLSPFRAAPKVKSSSCPRDLRSENKCSLKQSQDRQ